MAPQRGQRQKLLALAFVGFVTFKCEVLVSQQL
jgi:hypothetical protein